jgi:hypothetical protein
MEAGTTPMRLALLLLGSVLSAVSSARATETHGSADIGIWYLQSNIKGNSLIADDGYGENYIFDRYSLANIGLKLDALDLTSANSSSPLNAHFKGRFFYRLTDGQYTLGFPNRARGEIDELNVEAKRVADSLDLWFGRQLVFEAGGALFDGVRGIYHVNDRIDVALFGGLDADPRQLIGYIGPAYEEKPFSTDFQTGGIYTTYRGDQFKSDSSLRTSMFKGKLDRLALYTQASYQYDSVWNFAGSFDADIAGKPAIRTFTTFVTSRPVPWVTNTLSFMRWRTLAFKESNVSAIPVPLGVDPVPVGGTEINPSSYNSVRDHIQFRVAQRNYIFTAFQFTRRTFDNLNQYKYTFGYRDPKLFNSTYDLRAQTDLIDNFRGFNTAFDLIVGKEWREGVVRLEGGGTAYANERDIYVGYDADPSQPRQTEKEFSLRLNAYYNPNRTVSWLLNYALHHESDFINSQKINTHEVYLATGFRF